MSICAVVAAPESLSYCASRKNGTVDLFDKKKLLEFSELSTFLSVDHLS